MKPSQGDTRTSTVIFEALYGRITARRYVDIECLLDPDFIYDAPPRLPMGGTHPCFMTDVVPRLKEAPDHSRLAMDSIHADGDCVVAVSSIGVVNRSTIVHAPDN